MVPLHAQEIVFTMDEGGGVRRPRARQIPVLNGGCWFVAIIKHNVSHYLYLCTRDFPLLVVFLIVVPGLSSFCKGFLGMRCSVFLSSDYPQQQQKQQQTRKTDKETPHLLLCTITGTILIQPNMCSAIVWVIQWFNEEKWKVSCINLFNQQPLIHPGNFRQNHGGGIDKTKTFVLLYLWYPCQGIRRREWFRVVVNGTECRRWDEMNERGMERSRCCIMVEI